MQNRTRAGDRGHRHRGRRRGWWCRTGRPARGRRRDGNPDHGEELDRASAAALEHTGEGRVTETEKGDEESLYEVEVTLDDGSQVDVQLDARTSRS